MHAWVHFQQTNLLLTKHGFLQPVLVSQTHSLLSSPPLNTKWDWCPKAVIQASNWCAFQLSRHLGPDSPTSTVVIRPRESLTATVVSSLKWKEVKKRSITLCLWGVTCLAAWLITWGFYSSPKRDKFLVRLPSMPHQLFPVRGVSILLPTLSRNDGCICKTWKFSTIQNLRIAQLWWMSHTHWN